MALINGVYFFRLQHEYKKEGGQKAVALTAKEVFTKTVRTLPPNERLHLASLILRDLAQSEMIIVERSDTWSEQDQQDMTAFSLHYAAEIYPEDEELV